MQPTGEVRRTRHQSWSRLTAGTAISLALLAGSGCATQKASPPAPPRTGDALVDGKAAIAEAPAKDKVLLLYQTATAAMRRGQNDEAKALLDEALLRLGAVIANDKSARKARGYFSAESKKIFKGEPYERVMAYYYRGILYWMDNEPDNARACFRNAQVQDSETETKEYSSDYVLLDYLDGLASAKLAADPSDALKRAQATYKGGPLPPYDVQANTLFFVEFGQGPTKYATGEHHQELRFRTSQSAARSARVRIGDRSYPVPAYDDLNFQATTRGGRVMDHILANKAVFKSATEAIGTGALIGGAIVAANHNSQEVGLGIAAAGLLSLVISAATTPAADTRAWDTLPQHLGFSAIPLPPGSHAATVEFLDGAGQVIPRLTKTVNLNVAPAPRDTVIYVSDQSLTTRPQ